MVGAGGAGKAIAHAVACECPAELVVSNRSMGRAHEIVDRIKIALPEAPVHTAVADAAEFEVVIHATSLGLRDGDSSPIPIQTFQPGALVCEANGSASGRASGFQSGLTPT